MFISREARASFDELWDAIDSAPVIPPCQTTDPEIWFGNDYFKSTFTFARNLCARCPVRQKCLDYAMANDEEFGVWGGLSPSERDRLKRQKSPRP